jgi:hypothetical protein
MPTYGYGYPLTTRTGTVVAGASPLRLTAENGFEGSESRDDQMGDAIATEDDRGNAAGDDSEKKRGCDGVFHGDPVRPTQQHPAPLSSITSAQVAPVGFRDILADRFNVCQVCLDWERHPRLVK